MSAFTRAGRLLLLVVVALVALALPAAAHTSVASTTPADGATVEEPLAVVGMTFDAALAEDGDHLLGVFAPDGAAVDAGDTTRPSPDALEVSLMEGLPVAGTYTAKWVIVAADGDEQRGEFTFTATDAAVTAASGAGATDDAGSGEATSDVDEEATATEDDAPAEAATDDPATDDLAAEDLAADAAAADDAAADDGTSPMLPIVALLAVGLVISALLTRRGRGGTGQA